jgi:hypothetical protein
MHANPLPGFVCVEAVRVGGKGDIALILCGLKGCMHLKNKPYFIMDRSTDNHERE